MSRTSILILLSGFMLAGTLGLAHADVYRWVGKDGVVHYSDQWVPGAKLVMRTSGSLHAGSSAAALRGIAAESKAADRQIRQAADERTVQAKEAKLQAERCKSAKALYQRLIYARRLFTTGKHGRRHYLSGAQADAARTKALASMNRLCEAHSR